MVAGKLANSKKWTFEEYLTFEENSENKHEFYNGKPHKMAGGTYEHNLITANIRYFLTKFFFEQDIEGSLPNSDMKVQIPHLQQGFYPDVMVILGQPEFPKNGKRTVVLNPKIIVEVLSKLIPSLQEYILVDQEQCSVEIRRKSAIDKDAWVLEKFGNMEDVISLQSIDFQLSMKEIYHQIKFK